MASLMVVVAYTLEATFASSMAELEVAGPTLGMRAVESLERNAKQLTHSRASEKPLALYGLRVEGADGLVPMAF